MIDFRYHIVSLVSVFLALAVGIVLGAGPLRDDIGSQLSGQVEQLRTETEDLRGQVDAGEARGAEADDWISTIGPALVDGTLADEQVALVVTDESLAQASQQVTDLIRSAGGDVVLSVRFSPAMWEPDDQPSRSDALGAVREADPTLVSATGSDDAPAAPDRLAAAVGRVLDRDGEDGSAANRSTVLGALTDASLATVSGDVEAGATSVLVLTADPAPIQEAADPARAADVAGQRQDALAAMLSTLEDSQTPTVVAGTGADATLEEGLVFAVRRSGDLVETSTVDGLEHPEGMVAAILALAEQTHGVSGAYGTADGAAARLPDLDALAESTETATGDGSDAAPTAPDAQPVAPEEES